MKRLFNRIAAKTSYYSGSPYTFVIALLLIVIWAINGPIFSFSDTWQLVINTSTTIVTFLMVFLIQNTQNRDTRALHLKLDELLRSVKGARENFVDVENVSDDELEDYEREFRAVHEKYMLELNRRKKTPPVYKNQVPVVNKVQGS